LVHIYKCGNLDKSAFVMVSEGSIKFIYSYTIGVIGYVILT